MIDKLIIALSLVDRLLGLVQKARVVAGDELQTLLDLRDAIQRGVTDEELEAYRERAETALDRLDAALEGETP